MIDLAPKHLALVKATLVRALPECEVRVFGSRISGTAKPYSDLDLALVGREKLSPAKLEQLREAFAESDLPFRVDLIDWHDITDNFRQVIERRYERLDLSSPA